MQGSGAIGPSIDPQDAADRHLARRLDQHVAAGASAPAGDDALAFQIEQDVLEEVLRNRSDACDLLDLHGLAGRGFGEMEKRLEGVFGFLGDHRRLLKDDCWSRV